MWLAAGGDSKVVILDAQTTASQCQISLTSEVSCLAFSPSESTLAIVMPGRLELWNTTTGIKQKTQTLSRTASDGVHYAVAFSSQGQYLLLSIGRHLHLHHGTDTSELSVLSTVHQHKKVIFTSDDKQVITGSADGYIHFFTLSNNRLYEIQERRIFTGVSLVGLALRHDGKRLASSGWDGKIRIYDLPSRSPIATLRPPSSALGFGDIAYHPTEEELAVCHINCVVLWRQKQTPSDWVPSIHSNHSWPITGIAYCRNGTQMYMSKCSTGVALWTTTVTQVQELPKHAGVVECHAVNQPTSLLATGSYDKSIILWNFTTGDYRKTLLGHTKLINSLVFSDDGVLLASGGYDRMIIVWDVASGSLVHKLGPRDSRLDVLAFSEDNARLTTITKEECFVWELKSRELLERRDRDRSVDKAYKTLYHLDDFDRWKTVVDSRGKRCKYGLCRPPGEYQISQLRFGPIFGDRAALFCDDGRVLILDISRVMHVYMDPAGWLD